MLRSSTEASSPSVNRRGHRLGDVGELEVMRGTGVERLRDGERPVPERRLGREQLQVDEVTGERSQREQCLEPRNATSGDQGAKACRTSSVAVCRPFSGQLRPRCAERHRVLAGSRLSSRYGCLQGRPLRKWLHDDRKASPTTTRMRLVRGRCRRAR